MGDQRFSAGCTLRALNTSLAANNALSPVLERAQRVQSVYKIALEIVQRMLHESASEFAEGSVKKIKQVDCGLGVTL
jgi:hypothetical protein